MKTIALIIAFILVGAIFVMWLVSPFLINNTDDPQGGENEGK